MTGMTGVALDPQATALAQQLAAQGIPASTVAPDAGSLYSTYVVNGQNIYVAAGTDPSKPGDLSQTAQSYLAALSDPYLNQEALSTWQQPSSSAPALVPGVPASSSGSGGAAAGSASSPTTDPAVDLAQRNTIAALTAMFKQYGIESLVPVITSYVKQGYDATTVQLLLQDTPEYKQRFAGNDVRIKNGLAPLAPAEYLATERAYRSALSSAGIPQSYYDNHADFTNYISNDVSPAEIKTRADQAMQFVNESDPAYLNAFQQYYGAGRADIAAYFLDGGKNEALLSKQATAAQIGAAAVQQGLQAPGRYQAETYADQGVTQAQAQAGFQNVAAVLPTETQIGNRFHQQYTQQDAQDEFLGGLASAQRKRQQLNNDEQALFGGSSGVNVNSLKVNSTGSY